MSTLTQFAGGSQPVGSIVQAPYNLIDTNYLPCDGRAVSRSLYPLLSACLPNIGTFTSTARTKTLSGAPTSSAIANNGTVWVVTNISGTSNNLYTTPDGITYTARTTPATCDIRSILHDGTNFVAANAVAGAMQYSTDGGATWLTSATATVAAPGATSLQTCMTSAPTLGTVGRICIAGGGANFYTSDDRGLTWTARAHGLGGQVFNVCWTGQKFIATVGTQSVIYTSADGITWLSQALTFLTSGATANTGSIVSDGNGKVLWLDSTVQPSVYISQDHGVTWSVRLFGSPSGGTLLFSGNATAWYTNGRFFINGSVLLASTDLSGWAINVAIQSGVQCPFGISYKAGVYLINANNTSTAAFTAVEDASRIQLPGPAQNANNSWNNFMPFIKVK